MRFLILTIIFSLSISIAHAGGGKAKTNHDMTAEAAIEAFAGKRAVVQKIPEHLRVKEEMQPQSPSVQTSSGGEANAIQRNLSAHNYQFIR